jgi:hypothetical protein
MPVINAVNEATINVNRKTIRKADADRASRQRDQTGFGQKLAQDSKPCGTECRADGDFFLACCGASQKQVRDVSAGDQQYTTRGGEQQQQHPARSPQHLIAQRDDPDAETVVRFGMGRRKMAGNRIHFRLGLVERHSRTQTRDDVEIAVVTPGRITEFGHPEIDRILDSGDTQIVVCAERREMHVGQGNADDERRCRADVAQIDDVDVNNFADKACIRSEAALPKAAPDDDLGSGPLGIGRIECLDIERLAHQRYAENREELRRDEESAQSLAVIVFGEIDTPPSIARDGLETIRLSLPVEQVRRRSRRPQHAVRGVRRTKHDQAIRAEVWQGTDEHRVTDAEDRGVCPNANGEAQHGDDC